MITRNFIQTAPSWDKLPREIRANIDLLREMNPGWAYRFLDDVAALEMIDAAGFDVSALNTRYGAMIGDLARYAAVYAWGGVYLDIKSTCSRPFDDAVRDDVLVAVWPQPVPRSASRGVTAMPKGELVQWFFYARPKHDFLAMVLAKVQRRLAAYKPQTYGVGKPGVLFTTGPIPFTEAGLRCGLYDAARPVTDYGLRYSIYATMNGHFASCGTHYSRINEPLTRNRAGGICL
jgi:mannosyltransferase OCH1-like enzyme